MFQRMMRAYALQSDKKSLFRAVSVLLGVVLGGQHATADLTVHDSLNRYSLYGRKIIDIPYTAATSNGGWVGSDSLVKFGATDTVRSVLTSGKDIQFNNGGVWIWGDVRAARNLTVMYNDSISGKTYVGNNLQMAHENKYKGTVSVGGALSSSVGYNSNQVFGGNSYSLCGSCSFSSPAVIPGVTWGVNPIATPFSAWTFPDTSFVTTSIKIMTSFTTPTSGGVFRWTWGRNQAAGGSDLVGLGVCAAGDTILPPGSYGDLTLWYGSTLFLGQGTYSFNNVTLPAGSTYPTRLLAVQPDGMRTVIMIKGALSATPSSMMTVIAPELYTKGYGIDTAHFAGGTMMIYAEQPVTLGPSMELWATLVVPNHKVVMGDRVHLFGQILADSIIFANAFKGSDGAFIPYYPKRPIVNFANAGAFVSYDEVDLITSGVNIGDPDTTWAKIPVTLDHINGAPVTVYYHTEPLGALANGTTSAGTKDYVSVAKWAGSVTITATKLSDTIRIAILGDKVFESLESFRVVLDSVKNGDFDGEQIKIGQDIAVIVIKDNDPPPGHIHLTAANPVPSLLTRSVKDTVVFAYTVSMTNMTDDAPLLAQAGGVTVSLLGTSGTPGAVFGTDYRTVSGTNVVASTGSPNLTVTIPQGQSSTTFYVKVPPTAVYSPELKFQYSINCTNVTGSQCGTKDLSVLSTIQGIPAQLKLVGGSTKTNETSPAPVPMTASLISVETGMPVTTAVDIPFTWSTTNGTAVAPTHFVAVPAMTAGKIAANSGSAPLTVAAVQNLLYDIDRMFTATVVPATTNIATTPATATDTLKNGYPKMTIEVAPVTITRPLLDSVIKVPVRLSQKTTLAPVYSFKAVEGSAVEGMDFVVLSGSSNAAKTASQYDTIAVTIKGMAANVYDTVRHFKVVIHDWNNAIIESAPVSTDAALITIQPRLSVVRLLVDDASADQSKVDKITFPIRLVDGANAAVTSRIDLPFSFSTIDASAKKGVHFAMPSNPVGIYLAKATSSTLSLSLIQTTKYDTTRHFQVDLAPATWIKSPHDQATGTLINGFAKPSLIVEDDSIVRPKVATNLQVRVSLSYPSAIALPLTWETLRGSALADTDYVEVKADSTTIMDFVDLPVTIKPRMAEYDTTRHFSVIATGSDSNFAKAKDTGLVGILPAYGLPYLKVLAASVEEADFGVDSVLRFTVKLVDSTGADMTSRVGASFTWKTQDSLTTSALVAPYNQVPSKPSYWTASDRAYAPFAKDFVAVASASATVLPKSGSVVINVTIPGNNDKQADRMLSVLLIGATSARLNGAVAPIVNLGTILDNDSASNRAYFPVAKSVVPETLPIAWVAVRIKPEALYVDSVLVSVNAATTATSANYSLHDPVDSRDTTKGVGSAKASVTLKVAIGDSLLWVPVVLKHDRVRTLDLSLILDLKVLDGLALKADPGRSQTELVIANADAMPYLGFKDSVAKIGRGGSVSLPVGIRPVASDLGPTAQYSGVLRLVDTASALPVWSALVSTASTGPTPSFAGRVLDNVQAFATLNDGRSGPVVRAVLRLSNWIEARQPSGAESLQDSIVVTIDSTAYSKVNFFRSAKDTLVVQDVAGQASISLLLERSSWWKTAAGVKTDAVLPTGVFAIDTTLAFAPTDSVRSFVVRFGKDGKVAADRVFALHLSGLVRLQPGQDSILWVRIVNTNQLPKVKITSPAEGAKLGKKDLDSAGKVVVRWTVDGAAQAPSDTLLPEGPSTITRCYTDTAGNVGCDSVHVTLDTTPPVVTITAISKDSGKTWIVVGPNDTPWVNKPGIQVKWTSTDNGIETIHIDGETLKDSLSLVTRCIEDEVGNKGCGSRLVGMDQTPPKVWIVTPPVGSHWASSCVQSTWYEQDGAKIIRHDTTFCFSTVGPVTITVNSAPDRAGNVGTATNLIYIDPNLPGSATYVDSDGDGRIDAVVVQYPRPWTDAMPTFDISYGGPGKNTTGSSTVTYGTAGQTGTALVYNGDTIRVVAGTPVLDASGNAVVQADGTPLYQSSNGTPLLDASGKQVVSSEGIPLWKITAPSTAIDSSILVVKLATPYPYGWTSSTLTDLGVMHAVVNTIDSTGKVVPVKVTETFDIKDGVAPVILESRVIRTEDYNGKDTLLVQLSEAGNVTKIGGTGIIEISKDGGKTWIAVDVESISSTGTLKIVLEPGQDGSPSPGVLIRIAGNVTDASGNTSTSSSSPSVTVLGPQRPDLIKVTAPSTLLDVPANWGSQPVKGTFTFLTSDMDSNNLQAYKPGQGYTGNSSVSEVCPDIKLCAAFDLYVNRPSNTQLIIYDHVGTYVAKVVFTITSQDLAMIKRDKLDRARLRILWNLRDEKGSQVVSGVYLVRTVIRYTDTQDVGAKFDNFVIRYGVRVK